MIRAESREKNADIIARHKHGESHPSIAASYGLTKERVRQIVKDSGAQDRLSCIRERDAGVVEFLKREKATSKQAADVFSIPIHTVYTIVKKFNIALPLYSKRDVSEFEAMSKRVIGGESFLTAAHGDRNLSMRLTRWMISVGMHKKRLRRTKAAMRAVTSVDDKAKLAAIIAGIGSAK